MDKARNSKSITSIIIAVIIIPFILSSCKKEIDLLSGDIKAAKVENKKEYYTPLILEEGNVSKLILNGIETEFENGILELNDAGFYEMILDDKDTVLFVLLNEERVFEKRVFAEWGLKEWIPKNPVIDEDIINNFTIISPMNYYQGISVPFVVKLQEWSAINSVNVLCKTDTSTFYMKRGIASSSIITNNNSFNVTVGKQNKSIILNELSGNTIELEGQLNENYTIAANSIVRIKKDLIIPNTSSIVIGEGSVILVDEGVNIYNNGPIHFNGSEKNPILMTCSDPTKFFGGFISNGSMAEVNATNTFFTRFSHNTGGEFSYGHAQHQALFKSTSTKQKFQNCYFFDSPGQVFHPEQSELTISSCIVQRTKTTGQLNYGKAEIKTSYFSDFPDDSQNYRDNDNDGLYLNAIDANISDCVFMYTKDDGIDSGGDKGGIVNISNCVFEACFHEGLALSSVDPVEKYHTISSCLITNCQQGIELGFSSSNHYVLVDNCTISDNYIGVRFGDCYTRPIEGILEVKNSMISNNYKNSWNMVRALWAPYKDHLKFTNSILN